MGEDRSRGENEAPIVGEQAPWTPEQRAAIVAELRRKYPDRHIYPVQRENLASQWDYLADAAELRDARDQDEPGTWVPAKLAPLVTALRRTRVTRFFPFTGHECLNFAAGPGAWDGKGEVGPACVVLTPQGYLVYEGDAGRDVCTLTTHDPDEAAAEVERLLGGWEGSSPEDTAATRPHGLQSG
jgi:hypothetical protein